MAVLLRTLSVSFFFFILARSARCAVFVYEVTSTSGNRFVTASVKEPATYKYSNGGDDIIRALKVIKIFEGNSLDTAKKEFGLDDKNRKDVTTGVSDIYNRISVPFIWWR